TNAAPSPVAASRPRSSFTSARTTRAPSAANAFAHARPMPCAAPVTSATLPSRRMLFLRRCGGRGRCVERRHRRHLDSLERERLGRVDELSAPGIEPLGAAHLRAGEHRLLVLAARGPQVAEDEVVIVLVLLHRARERVDLL